MSAITVSLLSDFATSISPLLISYGVGLVFTLKNILPVEYGRPFGDYIQLVSVPCLIFRRLALHDPRTLNLKLLGADALSKFIPLALLLLWWRYFSKFDKIQSLEWVATFFMLTTIPNTVLIGDSILTPMFGESVKTYTTTIIFAQSLFWYNLVILLMEIRGVMMEDEQKKTSLPSQNDVEIEKGKQKFLFDISSSNVGVLETGGNSRFSRSFSAPPSFVTRQFPSSKWTQVHQAPTQEVALPGGRIDDPVDFPQRSASLIRSGSDDQRTRRRMDLKEQDLGNYNDKSSTLKVVLTHDRVTVCIKALSTVQDTEVDPQESSVSCLGEASRIGRTMMRVMKRISQTPLIYASSLGFTWSLLAFRYHWKLPTFVLSTLGLLADGTIGLAMVLLGLTTAKNIKGSKGPIPCGYKVLFAGFGLRFVFAPMVMIFCALAFALKGSLFRYAILQVIVPQGSMTFAIARYYNCKVNTMVTAIYVQMMVFIPIILAYYAVLEAI